MESQSAAAVLSEITEIVDQNGLTDSSPVENCATNTSASSDQSIVSCSNSHDSSTVTIAEVNGTNCEPMVVGVSDSRCFSRETINSDITENNTINTNGLVVLVTRGNLDINENQTEQETITIQTNDNQIDISDNEQSRVRCTCRQRNEEANIINDANHQDQHHGTPQDYSCLMGRNLHTIRCYQWHMQSSFCRNEHIRRLCVHQQVSNTCRCSRYRSNNDITLCDISCSHRPTIISQRMQHLAVNQLPHLYSEPNEITDLPPSYDSLFPNVYANNTILPSSMTTTRNVSRRAERARSMSHRMQRCSWVRRQSSARVTHLRY